MLKINILTLFLFVLFSCANDRSKQLTTSIVASNLTADKNSEKIACLRLRLIKIILILVKLTK